MMFDTTEPPSQFFGAIEGHAQNARDRAIVFIDAAVEDCNTLLAGLLPGAEAIALDLDTDGVQQMTRVLASRTDIQSVHVVSHGNPGLLQFGNSQLSLDNLNLYAPLLQQWRNNLTGKNLLLYGCNVAAGKKGAAFVEELRRLTGAEIAASTTLTGNAEKGGNWQLDYTTSDIKTSLAFQPEALTACQGILGFSIAYDAGVPDDVRTAVDYAVELLDGAFDTSADPLEIQVNWVPLGSGIVGTGTGGDGTSSDLKDFPGAPFPQPTPFYRIALANQLAGMDLNGDAPDITVNLNSNLDVPVYLGTDANPAADEVDLVTTVIHEIIHAIALGDLFVYDAATGTGSWKSGDITPAIYDTFLENGAGDRITDTSLFPNPSLALGNALTSNDLYFAGAAAIAANGGTRPKIYAPNPYEDGASILHLDEATFGDGDASLMTPVRAPGVAIHDPGPVTFAMLQDLGWKLNPDLKVTVAIDNPTPKTGDTIAYTVKVTNIGFSEATNIQLKNTFPADSLTLAESKVSAGTYNPDTGIWDLGNLGYREAVTLSLTATVTAASGIPFTNSAEITAIDQSDRNLRNNSAKLEITVANSAPALNDSGTPTLTPILEDAIDSTGTLVSALIASSGGITDPDINALQGIAVTAADNSNGTWQVSTDGSTWKDFPEVSDTSAILLALDANTKIRFIPKPNFFGNAGNLTFRAWDRTSGSNGETGIDTSENGGTSAFSQEIETASLAVLAVNDAPSFSKGSDITVSEDVGAVTISQWATRLSPGAGEAGQNLTSIFSSDNSGLFAIAPYIDAQTGNLTFTPNPNAFGTATVTVQLKDDGGTENGGRDISEPQIFKITITPINDPPAIANISKTATEPTKITFSDADFAGAFSDVENNGLSKILMASLPSNGTLTLNGAAVLANQEIPVAEVGNLRYIPGENFSGADSFGWNGFNGIAYAPASATVNLTMPVSAIATRNAFPECPADLETIELANANAIAVSGTETEDILYGSDAGEGLDSKSGSDIIIASDGNDNLQGSQGDDSLFGNQGADFLDGGEGDDFLHGGKDGDALTGNAGSDALYGNLGDDTLVGNIGNDSLYGNAGSDRLDAGEGEDILFGGKDSDTLNGSAGSDILAGDIDSDLLCGGAENDLLFGNVGGDTIAGEIGDDTLYGGKDSDFLNGGDGSDFLSGDLGSDTLLGGIGSDNFLLAPGSGSDAIADFEEEIDFLVLTAGLTFEQLSITQGSDATLIAIASSGELLASLSGVQASLIGIEDFASEK